MIKIADFKKFVDGLLKPVNNKAGKVDAPRHCFHLLVMK